MIKLQRKSRAIVKVTSRFFVFTTIAQRAGVELRKTHSFVKDILTGLLQLV